MHEVAAVERKVFNRLALDDLADRRGVGLDQRRRTGDLHRLRHFPDFQREVDASHLIHFETNVTRYLAESFFLDAHAVFAGRQKRQRVVTLLVGCRFAFEPGSDPGGGDLGAGHSSLGRVGNGTIQLSGGLGERADC